MHMRRRLDAGEFQRRSREVDATGQASAHHSPAGAFNAELFGNPNNKRRSDASFIQKLLAARHGASVIAEEADDSVVHQPFALQTQQHLANRGVELLDGIVYMAQSSRTGATLG